MEFTIVSQVLTTITREELASVAKEEIPFESAIYCVGFVNADDSIIHIFDQSDDGIIQIDLTAFTKMLLADGRITLEDEDDQMVVHFKVIRHCNGNQSIHNTPPRFFRPYVGAAGEGI